MTSMTTDIARPGLARTGWTRVLPPIGGLTLVAGLIGIMGSPMGDDAGQTPAEVVAFTEAHEGWLAATAVFGVVSIALAAAFVAGLAARLRGLATQTEAALVVVGGAVFTVCFALFLTVWTAPLVDSPDDRVQALAQAQAYLSYDDVGWFLLAATGVAAAVIAVPASVAGMRGGLPAWLGWAGVLAGLASVATIAFVGIFAWMAWIGVASIVLFVAPAREG